MKGKTNAVSGDNGMPTEKVNITLSSNQSSPSDLLGAKITLAYGAYSKEYIWEGKALTLEIPEYVIYTLSFSNVEGYATPSMLEFDAVGDNVRQIDALYQSEIVVVTVTADSGVSVAGQQVTINGVTTTLDATGVVSQKIPYGISYRISVNAKEGYNPPDVVNLIANQPSRTISMVYEEYKLGIFVQDISGRLWTEDEWKSLGYANSQANGVAVVSDSTRFVIAKGDSNDTTIAWGGYNKTITGVVNTLTQSDAVLDFEGKGNTDKIIEQCAGYTAQEITGSPAAESCASYVFPNGKNGYMGALGQWRIACNNKSAVNRVMTTIGGAAIQDAYYWSSTQGSVVYSWCLNWRDGTSTNATKNARQRVRAFLDL